MDDSPFRRIVLPALLVASAGFAALTWPVTSNHGTQVSERLPQPLGGWVDSPLVTSQHKEFPVRYIGFAILSSMAIGVGTAGVMRKQQVRLQRQQVFHQVLAIDLTAGEGSLSSGSALIGSALDGDVAVNPRETAAGSPLVDWAGLLKPTPEATPQAPALTAALLSTPIEAHELYQIRDLNQHRCLALKMGDEFYRFYRQRPGLDKTQALVQQLQQRGQRAIATRDGSGYVVWVHQPAPINPVSLWSRALASHQG